MRKQIAYPTFNARLFSTTIDMVLLALISLPIVRVVGRYLIYAKSKPYMMSHGINMQDESAVVAALNSQEFRQVFMTEHGASFYTTTGLIQLFIIGFYFVFCWRKYSATPGKYICGMRVVDSGTLERPTILQAVRRLISCALFIVGIWFIIFTSRKQALHDKVAGTVVIKR